MKQLLQVLCESLDLVYFLRVVLRLRIFICERFDLLLLDVGVDLLDSALGRILLAECLKLSDLCLQ